MWLSTVLPGRSAGKSTSSAVGSASAADGVGDDMQAIRDHLRAVGSGIGVGLGALLTGLGYTQIHNLPDTDTSQCWRSPAAQRH